MFQSHSPRMGSQQLIVRCCRLSMTASRSPFSIQMSILTSLCTTPPLCLCLHLILGVIKKASHGVPKEEESHHLPRPKLRPRTTMNVSTFWQKDFSTFPTSSSSQFAEPMKNSHMISLATGHGMVLIFCTHRSTDQSSTDLTNHNISIFLIYQTRLHSMTLLILQAMVQRDVLSETFPGGQKNYGSCFNDKALSNSSRKGRLCIWIRFTLATIDADGNNRIVLSDLTGTMKAGPNPSNRYGRTFRPECQF